MSPWAPAASHSRSRAAAFGRGVGAREADRGKAESRGLFLQPLAKLRLAFQSSFSRYHGSRTRGRPSHSAAGLAIEAQGLVKAFDGKTAVDGIDLAVPEGSIYGILGPNGAGKTTTLAHAARHHRARPAASARLLGHDRPLEAARIVGYLPEERGLYPAMTAREAIAFMGALRGLPLEIGPQARRDPARARTASATMSTSRSGASPRAWRRPSSCSARSSTSRS